MLSAETAILVHLKTIRIVLLVLERVVVALLAFRAGQSDLCTHLTAPPVKIASLIGRIEAIQTPAQVELEYHICVSASSVFCKEIAIF